MAYRNRLIFICFLFSCLLSIGKGELADAPWHNFKGEILENIKFVNFVPRNANMAIEISIGNIF